MLVNNHEGTQGTIISEGKDSLAMLLPSLISYSIISVIFNFKMTGK